MAPKSPNKKKSLTLEDFAAAIQKDYRALNKKMDTQYRAIRKDMATKADLWPMQRDIKTLEKNVHELQEDVKMITETMVSKADLAETLAHELAKSEYARQLGDIRERVNVLESKLGIKPIRRAA